MEEEGYLLSKASATGFPWCKTCVTRLLKAYPELADYWARTPEIVPILHRLGLYSPELLVYAENLDDFIGRPDQYLLPALEQNPDLLDRQEPLLPPTSTSTWPGSA